MFIIMEAKPDGLWIELRRASSLKLAEQIAQNREAEDENAYVQVFEWKAREKKG